MPSRLEARALAFGYPGHAPVLDAVDLTLRRGEVCALLGPNGAGKTTLLRLLLGLLRPTKGEILLEGVSLQKLTGKERALRMAYVPQEALPRFPMTVFEAVLLGRKPHMRWGPGKNDLARTGETLARLGLEALAQRPLDALSGGQRQRVCIGTALIQKPGLIIADEAVSALDVTIQAQILELMQELRKKLGMSIIMITHDLGVVASMCERIAVMYAGHIVEYGTADEIFYEPKHEYTKGLIKSIPKLNVQETERLIPIEGQPVDLLNPPAGCPFAPRCANCMKICLREMPPKTELSDTHYSQCWLLQKEEFEKGEISCE